MSPFGNLYKVMFQIKKIFSLLLKYLNIVIAVALILFGLWFIAAIITVSISVFQGVKLWYVKSAIFLLLIIFSFIGINSFRVGIVEILQKRQSSVLIIDKWLKPVSYITGILFIVLLFILTVMFAYFIIKS